MANGTISRAVLIAANVSYDHRSILPGGLDITQTQVNIGAWPYRHMSSEVVGNFNAKWTSPVRHLSLTGYVRNVGRNVTDHQYFQKRTVGVSATTGQSVYQQTFNDPRTYGAVLNVGF